MTLTPFIRLIKNPEFGFTGLFLIFFVFLLAQVPGFPAKARTFPYIIASGGALICGLIMARAAIQTLKSAVKADAARKPLHKRFWLTMGLLLIYMVCIYYIGFYIPTLVFVPLSMYVMGVRKPLTFAITTVAVIAAAYLLFGRALGIPLLYRLFG